MLKKPASKDAGVFVYVTGQRSLGPVGAARRAARLDAGCRCTGRGTGPALPTDQGTSKSTGTAGAVDR